MPTKTYRFYDPAHQASFQHLLQTSDRTVLHNRPKSGQKKTSAPWAQSNAREEFERAQRGQDMSHIVPHQRWIQYDLSNAVPNSTSSSSSSSTGETRTCPINLYIRSSESSSTSAGDAWIHCGAALLTLHYPVGADRRSQSWVTIHSHGSGRLAATFSVFSGMQLIRFNDSVLCTTVQASSGASRFVTYSFQCETVDQATELRHMLASAASAALPSSGITSYGGSGHGHSSEALEGSMERRLSSWIHAIEEQLVVPVVVAAATHVQQQHQQAQFDPSTSFASFSFDMGGHGVRPEIAALAPALPPPPRRIQRRGGVDLGDGYWDLEKCRALQEAKTELDSLQLKRLLSGFEL